MAFIHDGFWQCMDTIRDKELLREALPETLYEWMHLKERKARVIAQMHPTPWMNSLPSCGHDANVGPKV